MAISKIIVRFKDGKLLKGRSNDFSPGKKVFHMSLISREEVKINVEELKAIFFIKDFKGNKEHQISYKDALPWGGNKVKVVFYDDEEIIGYTQHYSQEDHGFFVIPADLKCNNERIFVIVSATKKITFI
jgi:hypothetical protein